MDWLQANWFSCVTVSVCVATLVRMVLAERIVGIRLKMAEQETKAARVLSKAAEDSAHQALESEVRAVAAERACRKCLLAHGPLTTKEG